MVPNASYPMTDGHYRPVVTDNRIGIQLLLQPTVLICSKLLLNALPRLLVEVNDCRAVVIMNLGTTQQQKINDFSVDSALLHPGYCMLRQFFHRQNPRIEIRSEAYGHQWLTG